MRGGGGSRFRVPRFYYAPLKFYLVTKKDTWEQHPANLIPPLTTKHASALSVDGTPSLARCRDNCERSSQYNTRQFQCNSCPAGSLFKFSLTVHRTAVSRGGRPGQVFLRGTCPSSSSIFNATPSHERSAAPTYPGDAAITCLLYTSPSPRDLSTSRMPSSA